MSSVCRLRMYEHARGGGHVKQTKGSPFILESRTFVGMKRVLTYQQSHGAAKQGS